jgi:trk system potassium uptake protein
MFSLRPILLVNGILLLILSAAMLVPAFVDYMANDRDWKAFLLSAFITAFVGGSLYFANRGYSGALTLRQTFLFTASSWFVVSCFGALPFMLSELNASFTDAFFETASGLTTTGSTVFAGLDNMHPGILLWRSLLQGMGGIGVVVLAMAILPMLSVGGMQLFRSESSDKADKVLPRARQIAKVTAYTYFTLVFICGIAYWLAGMSAFDALCHAFPTISTGGFSTKDMSLGYFENLGIEIIAMAGMFAGSLPMLLYFQMARGDFGAFWRSSEIRWFTAIVVITTLVLTNWLIYSEGENALSALRMTSFSVISTISTTGFVTADYNNWGTGAVLIMFFLLAVGGCSGSTAGAIKVWRFQVLYEVANAQIQRMLHPNGIFLPRYNGKPISESIANSVLIFLVLYAFTFTVFTIIVAMFGLDYITAMSGVAQAIGNVGPGLGPIIGPVGNFVTIPDGAKWTLAIAMIVGRLELLTILVLFTKRFWID